HQALRMAGAHPDPPPGVNVEQLFDPSLPEISGDAAALERVFLNLIRNGLEAITALPSTAEARSNAGLEAPVESTADSRCRKLRLKTALETQFRMTSHGRRRQFLRVEI